MTSLVDSDWWEPPVTQERLFSVEPVSTALLELRAEMIRVDNVSVRRIVHLQREMSRVTWRPSPGRNLGFVVMHGPSLLGIGFLSSPVFALKARDEYLGLPAGNAERGEALRHYADLSVCVGAQPIAWHWNIGKLIAQLATTLGDLWLDSYGDELTGVTTTSVYGKGSQYNRLWKFLGYTKGYGNCHIPDHVYREMVAWMDRNGVARHDHTESSVRMRNVGRFRRAVPNTSLTQFHGDQRAIYYAPAVGPDQRPDVVSAWYERWGRPRYERTKDFPPPYHSGTEEALRG